MLIMVIKQKMQKSAKNEFYRNINTIITTNTCVIITRNYAFNCNQILA